MQEAALAIISNDKGEILLVQRSDVPVWVLPGGGIEPNELAEHAAQREVFEETGLPIEIIDHVATYRPINRLTSTTFLFTSHPRQPLLPHTCSEVAAVAYFPRDGLPKSIFPLHRTFIDEVFSAASIPIDRPLHETTYWAFMRHFLIHPMWMVRYFITRWSRPSTTSLKSLE